METYECEYCKINFKNQYTLKSHMNGSKKCLKKRGLELDSNNVCIGCKLPFLSKYKLLLHEKICKEIMIIKYVEEIETIKKENELQIEKIKKENELQIETIKKENEYTLKLYENLQKQNDKLQDRIETLAKEAINRPTTTNINFRNHLSTTYTLDELKEEDLLEIFRENFTKQIFMSGHKGIAKMCTDKIINTKDEKKLICCTDTSRKKFKYMDNKGNLKEDIEARMFVDRVSKPIKDVGKKIYENIMEKITDERDQTKPEEYGKKERLVFESFQVMDRYKDIINIDDPKYNLYFTNELAILNKND